MKNFVRLSSFKFKEQNSLDWRRKQETKIKLWSLSIQFRTYINTFSSVLILTSLVAGWIFFCIHYIHFISSTSCVCRRVTSQTATILHHFVLFTHKFTRPMVERESSNERDYLHFLKNISNAYIWWLRWWSNVMGIWSETTLKVSIELDNNEELKCEMWERNEKYSKFLRLPWPLLFLRLLFLADLSPSRHKTHSIHS